MNGKELLSLISSLPERHYVTLEREKNEDDEPFISACLFERAPDDGWESRGAYFRHPPDSPSHQQSARPYENDDRVIVAVSSSPNDPRFWPLLTRMLREQKRKRRTAQASISIQEKK